MRAWSGCGSAILILLGAGCAQYDVAKDAAPQEDQGPAVDIDHAQPNDSTPEVDDIPRTDGEVWEWDDSRLGQACNSIWDDCGEGNICLADITCLDICQRHGEDNASYYKCQRKCRADEHCSNRPGQRCVTKLVGDGETDVANLCISACLPEDATNSIALEDCRSRQEASDFSTWPPSGP
jgi:hypothetical protein